MPPSDEIANRKCPACDSAVPAASFCGDCGARLDAPVDTWTQLLRPKVFANAHREAIWVPRVSSGLFPRIAGETRRPYRIGLITVLRAMSRRWRAQDEGRIPASDDDRVPYGPVPTKPAAKPAAG